MGILNILLDFIKVLKVTVNAFKLHQTFEVSFCAGILAHSKSELVLYLFI